MGETANLGVGIDMGPWETVMTQKADRGGTSTLSRDGQQYTVTFQKATAGPLSGAWQTQVALSRTSPMALENAAGSSGQQRPNMYPG